MKQDIIYSIFERGIIIVDLNWGVPVPVPDTVLVLVLVSVPESIILLVTWSVTYRDIIFDIPDLISILYSVTSSADLSVAREIIFDISD